MCWAKRGWVKTFLRGPLHNGGFLCFLPMLNNFYHISSLMKLLIYNTFLSFLFPCRSLIYLEPSFMNILLFDYAQPRYIFCQVIFLNSLRLWFYTQHYLSLPFYLAPSHLENISWFWDERCIFLYKWITLALETIIKYSIQGTTLFTKSFSSIHLTLLRHNLSQYIHDCFLMFLISVEDLCL